MKKSCLIALTAILSSCSGVVEKENKPLPPPIIKDEPIVMKESSTKHGPPDHAKAHGYRKKFGYTYYPEQKVYQSKEKNTWFWIENGEWKVGAKLPTGLDVTGKASEEIELDAETPYEHSKGEDEKGKGKGKGKGKNK